MERTITVKGKGRASFKPDTIVLELALSALDQKYDAAMAASEKQLNDLRNALTSVGFDRSDVKTTDFNVRTEKKSVHDKNGNYSSMFAGYRCLHSLKVQFDFDTERLGKALSAISDGAVAPELTVSFTVKDKEAAIKSVLESAARSAREKAEVLAAASGVKLGELVKIDYNISEHDINSPTRYLACNGEAAAMSRSIDIVPEDVSVSDYVMFTWIIG